MLSYKAELAGKHVIKADKMFPSSLMCHECGCLNPETKDLKVRGGTVRYAERIMTETITLR